MLQRDKQSGDVVLDNSSAMLRVQCYGRLLRSESETRWVSQKTEKPGKQYSFFFNSEIIIEK